MEKKENRIEIIEALKKIYNRNDEDPLIKNLERWPFSKLKELLDNYKEYDFYLLRKLIKKKNKPLWHVYKRFLQNAMLGEKILPCADFSTEYIEDNYYFSFQWKNPNNKWKR